jgi:hypothetical protein
MTDMQAIAPDPLASELWATGTGTDHGVLSDASIEIRLPGEQTFTLRTLLRLGERIGEAGLPHSTLTDTVSVASLAASSLMLQSIPAGLPRPEMIKRLEEADAESKSMASDRGCWSLARMTLGQVSYALWHRSHALGFVAHADLGDRVLAAWGTGSLPPELRQVQLVEVRSLPNPAGRTTWDRPA